MDNECLEEISSADENLTQKNISAAENRVKESNLIEDSIESDSAEEYLIVESSSTDEYSVEESSFTEDLAEDSSFTEDLAEDSSFTEVLAEESSSAEYSAQNSFTDERSLAEENSTEEIYSTEDTVKEMKENWIEKHGLVFQDTSFEKHRSLQVVIVGDGKLEKTKLIESVFADNSSYTDMKHATRINISLSTFFNISVYDVKETEFLHEAEFLEETVFLFCYDVDNSESLASLGETWILPVLERYLKEMYYVLVGIKHDSKTKLKSIAMLNRKEQKMAIEKKTKELNRRFLAGWLVECSTDDKHSMLKVFQSALDVVYPRF